MYRCILSLKNRCCSRNHLRTIEKMLSLDGSWKKAVDVKDSIETKIWGELLFSPGKL